MHGERNWCILFPLVFCTYTTVVTKEAQRPPLQGTLPGRSVILKAANYCVYLVTSRFCETFFPSSEAKSFPVSPAPETSRHSPCFFPPSHLHIYLHIEVKGHFRGLCVYPDRHCPPCSSVGFCEAPDGRLMHAGRPSRPVPPLVPNGSALELPPGQRLFYRLTPPPSTTDVCECLPIVHLVQQPF